MSSVLVTAVDTETGATLLEVTVEGGNYAFVAVDPCRLVDEQHYESGTSVLTLRGRDPQYTTTRFAEPAPPLHVSSVERA
jgi:hypothetical protein